MRWDYVVEGKVYGGVSGFVIAVAASRPVKGTSAETSSLLVLIWTKEPHWDRFVFVCVRSALQNVQKQSKFYPIPAALGIKQCVIKVPLVNPA